MTTYVRLIDELSVRPASLLPDFSNFFVTFCSVTRTLTLPAGIAVVTDYTKHASCELPPGASLLSVRVEVSGIRFALVPGGGGTFRVAGDTQQCSNDDTQCDDDTDDDTDEMGRIAAVMRIAHELDDMIALQRTHGPRRARIRVGSAVQPFAVLFATQAEAEEQRDGLRYVTVSIKDMTASVRATVDFGKSFAGLDDVRLLDGRTDCKPIGLVAVSAVTAIVAGLSPSAVPRARLPIDASTATVLLDGVRLSNTVRRGADEFANSVVLSGAATVLRSASGSSSDDDDDDDTRCDEDEDEDALWGDAVHVLLFDEEADEADDGDLVSAEMAHKAGTWHSGLLIELRDCGRVVFSWVGGADAAARRQADPRGEVSLEAVSCVRGWHDFSRFLGLSAVRRADVQPHCVQAEQQTRPQAEQQTVGDDDGGERQQCNAMKYVVIDDLVSAEMARLRAEDVSADMDDDDSITREDGYSTSDNRFAVAYLRAFDRCYDIILDAIK